MKPVIGITPSPSEDALPHGTFLRYSMSSSYTNAVLAAGGIPVILPPQDDHAAALLDAVDGLLLSGGGDVDPARYGDYDVHPATYGVDAARDRFELELIGHALQRDLPLLCICRGVQVLNVALGGTLLQDVESQHPGSATIPGAHRQHHAGLTTDASCHLATLVAGTSVSALFGAADVAVNSFHHQVIKNLAPSLEVAAYSPDGLIEAVTVPGKTFAIGVQWHPEMMYERFPEQLKPFQALVEAARARRLAPIAV